MDTIFLAKALCYGFSLEKDELEKAAKIFNLREGFVHGIVFLINNTRPVNTIIGDRQSSPEKAIKLTLDGDVLVARNNGEKIIIKIIDEPSTISGGAIGKKKVSDFFSMHSPKTLFTTPLRECVFAVENEICKFCTFENSAMQPLAPEEFLDVVSKVANELGFVPSIAIGAGTPNKNDHGVRYFSQIVGLLKKEFNADISVEMVPPHDIEDLSMLFDAGVNSMVMSLELWNDEKRKYYCPGKSYISKNHYLEAHKFTQKNLGRGTTSSVLLYGLESHDESVSGISKLTSSGIVPTLIPFRPYPDTEMSNYPYANHNEYVRISAMNRLLMSSEGIGPQFQKGCAECGGCSIEIVN